MYRDKGGIKINTNMLFMKRFITSRMFKIVQIPKGAGSNKKKGMDASYSLIQKHIHPYTMFHTPGASSQENLAVTFLQCASIELQRILFNDTDRTE